MEKILFFQNLKVSADMQQVLAAMDCFPDSPLYEEACDEYEIVKENMLSACRPVALAAFSVADGTFQDSGIQPGSEILCVLRSIGFDASRTSGDYFAQGDYLKGMIADRLADHLLFSIEADLNPRLMDACRQRSRGVAARFDPPNQVPMTVQRFIYNETQAGARLGFGLSTGFMIDPQKSCSTLYLLTDDVRKAQITHDCRKCPNLSCRDRKRYGGRVTVYGHGTIEVRDGQTLLDAFRENSIYIPAFCGGGGRCGKCAVVVTGGTVEPSEADKSFFTAEELASGKRLACTAWPEGDAKVRICADDESNFDVVAEKQPQKETASGPCAIAVDIGTTTVTVALIDRSDGRMLESISFVNRQRMYGADVISRQTAAVSGQADAMRDSIRGQLLDGIESVVLAAAVSPERVTAVGIAANTTMVHLLMGWPCDGLGVAPFRAHSLAMTQLGFSDLFASSFLDCPVIIMPGISAYVGGDIVSGILRCAMADSDRPVLLLDLGTNGEMALGDRSGIICTSTAAGPAFEGGNISCGTGSIPGAICSVRIEDNAASVQTIGGQPPVGLCGTGVIETAAELVNAELVDETGRLDDTYFDQGFPLAETEEGRPIRFTQKDVREIQLAKSAVRAGLETLLLRRKITYDDLGAVLLAGGFGYRTDKEKAAAIGMLPKELLAITRAVGNSSLDGVITLLTEPGAAEKAVRIAENAVEIGLAADQDFSRLYMEHMYFEEE